MTNYEFIKSLWGTRLRAALYAVMFQSNWYIVPTKEEMIDNLTHFLYCKDCRLYQTEDTDCCVDREGCEEMLAKWLNSPVDDIIVLSKLPKEYPLQSKMEFEQGWNACISYILTQMLSSEEENIE